MTDLNAKAQRTRRNALKIAMKMATLGSAAFWGASAGRANTPPVPVPPNSGTRCLLKGAMVLTAQGERRVENLAIGDLVPTMFGGTRPIQWIGRFPIKKSIPSALWPTGARPVRIARSAIAPNVPQTDLYVSQAHALFFEGALVEAGCLINGATITLDEAGAFNELEYFHIKLDKHDVIYAEGLPVETLLQVDESAVNFADYFRAYGIPTDSEVSCLPILSNSRRGSDLKARIRHAVSWADRRRQIRAIRDRLAQRGMMLSLEKELSL